MCYSSQKEGLGEGVVREFGTDRYTLLDLKWITNKDLLYSTGNCSVLMVPLSMGFSRQEYWSGLPFPSPGDLSYPGIEHRSPVLQADSLPSGPPGKS